MLRPAPDNAARVTKDRDQSAMRSDPAQSSPPVALRAVFQRGVMLAIERAEPATLAELARVPGLGPAKVDRFGEDVLAIVRQHRSRRG